MDGGRRRAGGRLGRRRRLRLLGPRLRRIGGAVLLLLGLLAALGSAVLEPDLSERGRDAVSSARGASGDDLLRRRRKCIGWSL